MLVPRSRLLVRLQHTIMMMNISMVSAKILRQMEIARTVVSERECDCECAGGLELAAVDVPGDMKDVEVALLNTDCPM